jgi:hypothetical protein
MGQAINRGVDTEPATQEDLDTYRQAQAQLDRMRIPVLLPADDPHARLYIAALDGTGNSMLNDNPETWSVVATSRTWEPDLPGATQHQQERVRYLDAADRAA